MLLASSLTKSSGKEKVLQPITCHFRRTPKRITVVRILREFILTAYASTLNKSSVFVV